MTCLDVALDQAFGQAADRQVADHLGHEQPGLFPQPHRALRPTPPPYTHKPRGKRVETINVKRDRL